MVISVKQLHFVRKNKDVCERNLGLKMRSLNYKLLIINNLYKNKF